MPTPASLKEGRAGLKKHRGANHCFRAISRGEFQTKLGDSLAKLPNNDRCIVAAKPKAITHCVGNFAFLWNIRRVVQIAVRIRVGQINRRGNDPFLKRLDRHDEFNPATRSQGMAQLTLRATDAQVVRVLSENGFLCLRKYACVRSHNFYLWTASFYGKPVLGPPFLEV